MMYSVSYDTVDYCILDYMMGSVSYGTVDYCILDYDTVDYCILDYMMGSVSYDTVAWDRTFLMIHCTHHRITTPTYLKENIHGQRKSIITIYII